METQERGKKGSQSARREGKRRGIEWSRSLSRKRRCTLDPFSPARFSTQRLFSRTHTYIYVYVGNIVMVLLRFFSSSRWRIFSSCGGLSQFLRERRPWPSPDLGRYLCGPYTNIHIHLCLYACVLRACMCERAHVLSTSFRRVFRSFVHSVPKSRRKANSGKRRRQGVAAISCTAKHVYLVEKYLLRSLCRRY